MSGADTIVAIASAAGQAGIGVVRVSGPDVRAVMSATCSRVLPAREACLARFKDAVGCTIDEGIALYFPGPQSYTGEDVLELQGHGSPVVLRRLVQRCIELGARLAEPGEFTRRAFLNDKLDLAQAEAVADLISASSEQAARSAMRSLQGEFSDLVRVLQGKLTDVRVFVEASLDFPEDDIDPTQLGRVPAALRDILQAIDAALTAAAQGSLLREGLRVALIGPPNSGKSSIINRLSNDDVAIVTPIPGTTRDLIRQTVDIRGLPVHIVDTAGLRETQDPIEAIGIARTWDAVALADLVVLVSEPSTDDEVLQKLRARLPEERPLIHVHNKIDLVDRPASMKTVAGSAEIWVSAKTGDGFDLLEGAIADTAGWSGAGEGVFMARERHVQALTRCREHLRAASTLLAQTELAAEELRHAQLALSELTGEVVSDDLLGQIFSRFCIGK
jgi:tRNA modification GTPase